MNLSVVMAVFNGQEYLKESIDSVLNQTYQEFEFIIVDDASTDKTRKILRKITDKRVKVIHLKKNVGLGGALHAGVQKASGTWIARHDADDISLPARFEEQINYIRSNPGAVVIGSLIENIPGRTPLPDTQLRAAQRHFNSFVTREQINDERFHGCPICFGACVFSKEAYLRAGGYDPTCRLCEDYDLLLRLFQIGNIEIVPKVLYQYRVEANSLSRKNWGKTSITIASIAMKYLCRFCYTQQKPRFIVFGTERGCKMFKRKIAAEGNFKVVRYVCTDLLQHAALAIDDYHAGSADGILVLDAPDSPEVVTLLQNAGIQLNRNLFRLHNIW